MKNLAELDKLARRFARRLRPQKNGAAVVGLYGELGAGKTAFVQSCAKALEVAGQVTSPSFVIEKIYFLPPRPKGFHRLIHLDCFRLAGAAELLAIGWEIIIADPVNLIFVEWAERIKKILPSDCLRVKFAVAPNGSRWFSFLKPRR